jgi:hypothetical protein
MSTSNTAMLKLMNLRVLPRSTGMILAYRCSRAVY